MTCSPSIRPVVPGRIAILSGVTMTVVSPIGFFSPTGHAVVPSLASRDQFVRNLRRPVALGPLLGFRIVAALQHGAFTEPLAADDDRDRAAGAALLGMDRARRHQIDLALRAGGDGGKLDLGIVGTAAVVEAVVTL